MNENKLSTRDLAAAADSERADKLAASGGGQMDQQPPRREAGASAAEGRNRDRVAGEAAALASSADTPADSRLGRSPSDERGPLLPHDQTSRFSEHWQQIQGSFVDQPREAVEHADALVADLMQRLAASFSNERERLEAQWDRGDDVSTEDLRVALTRYRSFFDRLLSA